MVSQELITEIQHRFGQGQRRNEIKEDLYQKGYEEDDIDDAIAKIQHDAIKQLPGISWIYKHVEHFESKPTAASPRTTILLMAACIAFLLLLAGLLFLFFDPLGTGSTSRDVKRQSDTTAIQNGLTAYYQKNQVYPRNLDMLVPTYLPSLPKDPQSGQEYTYKPLDNNSNYQLCINLEEQQQQQCVNAAPLTSGIPIVPTDTPVPTFAPQSASGAPSYQAE